MEFCLLFCWMSDASKLRNLLKLCFETKKVFKDGHQQTYQFKTFQYTKYNFSFFKPLFLCFLKILIPMINFKVVSYHSHWTQFQKKTFLHILDYLSCPKSVNQSVTLDSDQLFRLYSISALNFMSYCIQAITNLYFYLLQKQISHSFRNSMNFE